MQSGGHRGEAAKYRCFKRLSLRTLSSPEKPQVQIVEYGQSHLDRKVTLAGNYHITQRLYFGRQWVPFLLSQPARRGKGQKHMKLPEQSTELDTSGAIRLPVVLANPKSAPAVAVAALVFDSDREGCASTLRCGLGSARQLLYKAGNLCIDVYMLPRPGANWVAVTGQLLDSTRPQCAMRNVPVDLQRDDVAIAHKRTNAMGEFDFGVQRTHRLQLVFGINERRKLVVPVPELEGMIGRGSL